MRDGWEVLQFGEVLNLDVVKTPVVDGRQYPIVGVLGYGRGLLYRDPVASESTSYRELNRIGPNQLVYSKLKAFEGAITVTPADLPECYASGEFPTFAPTARVVPAFINLMTQRSELWEMLAVNSKGMGGRRERLNPLDFLTMSAVFPPVLEQRRIVDLVGALDTTITAVSETLKSLRHLRSMVVEVLPGELTPLGELLLRVEAGKSPSGEDRRPLSGERAVLKVSAIGPSGFDPSEVKVVPSDEPLPSGSDVRNGDVLMVRASGTVNRVGITCRVQGDHPQLHLCDKTLRLVPRIDRVDAWWLNGALSSAHSRRQIVSLATGSDMRNISQRAIMQVRIPAPPDRNGAEHSAAVQALDESCTSATRLLGRLRGMRSNLLTAILSGEHEVPESYGELMGEAS
jgi:type I restriction enzyme S subunit